MNDGGVPKGTVVTVSGVSAVSGLVDAVSVSEVLAGVMFVASIDVAIDPVSDVTPLAIAALTTDAGIVMASP